MAVIIIGVAVIGFARSAISRSLRSLRRDRSKAPMAEIENSTKGTETRIVVIKVFSVVRRNRANSPE